MLLTGRILECYGCAAAAKRQAEGARDPASQADFLKMEKSWLTLAQSLEASERLTDFIGDARVRKDLGGVITHWNVSGAAAHVAVGSAGLFRISPGHQLLDAGGRPQVDELGEPIGQPGQGIDPIQLACLCRTANYAERTRFRQPLSRSSCSLIGIDLDLSIAVDAKERRDEGD